MKAPRKRAARPGWNVLKLSKRLKVLKQLQKVPELFENAHLHMVCRKQGPWQTHGCNHSTYLYLYPRGKWLLVLTSCRRAQFVPVASLLEVSFSLQIFNLRAEIGDETQSTCNSVTVTTSNLQVDMFAVACFT
jgi:hypothetical protein